MYYLGTFFHTLDAKGRLFVPARFRENLGEEFVLFKSPDKCISIYDNANFEKLIDQVKMLSRTPKEREMQRRFFASAVTVTMDKQGRFTVPQDYIEYASLGTEVVLTGEANRLEIWSKASHDAREAAAAALSPEDYPEIIY